MRGRAARADNGTNIHVVQMTNLPWELYFNRTTSFSHYLYTRSHQCIHVQWQTSSSQGVVGRVQGIQDAVRRELEVVGFLFFYSLLYPFFFF